MENANNSEKQESFADLLEESFAKNLKIRYLSHVYRAKHQLLWPFPLLLLRESF